MIQNSDPSLEDLDVIDCDNRPVRQATKRDIYVQRLSHRIVHVFVLRGDQIFIQKRGISVAYLPGHYCTSAGGHVLAGEHPDAAAPRELREELSLDGPVEKIAEFWFDDTCRVRIYLYVKRMIDDEEMRFCPREVSGGEFVHLAQVEQLDRTLWHPQLEPCLDHLRSWTKNHAS